VDAVGIEPTQLMRWLYPPFWPLPLYERTDVPALSTTVRLSITDPQAVPRGQGYSMSATKIDRDAAGDPPTTVADLKAMLTEIERVGGNDSTVLDWSANNYALVAVIEPPKDPELAEPTVADPSGAFADTTQAPPQ